MFCEKCGAQNQDGAKFCGKCGADLRVKDREIPESEPKKKKSKKRLIITVVAVVLVAAIAVGVLFILKPFGSSGGSFGSDDSYRRGLIYEHDGMKFVCMKRPFYTENGTDYYGTEKLVNEDSEIMPTSPDYNCFDGQDFYGISNDGYLRYHWDNGKYTVSRLVDYGNTGEDYFGKMLAYATCYTPEGGSIYFNISMSAYGKMTEPCGRIGKINKESGKVERIGDADITAYAITVSDGWIYFLDIDYEKKGNKAGVYKMKTDGTEKTLLHSEEIGTSQTVPILVVDSGYLYYINNYIGSGSSEHSINRIKTDGSGYEKLVSNTEGYFYKTFTVSGDKLYFPVYTGKGAGTGLDVLDLDTKELKRNIIPSFPDASFLDVDGGYLYFYTYNFSSLKDVAEAIRSTDPDNPDKYWKRFKIDEDYKPECFYAYKTDEGYVKGFWKTE